MKKNKMDLQDEIDDNILGIKKENPFKVPEHYFDTLGVRVADRIHSQSPEAVQHVPVFSRLKPILVYSTGFAGLAIILYFGISFFNTKPQTNVQVSNQELANNFEYNLVSGIDEATLIENLSQETKTLTDTTVNTTEKDPIIEYLVREDVDMNTIIDAL